jgi:hypothetical protein
VDQDGNGDPLNEEMNIKGDCNSDFRSGLGEAVPGSFGYGMETTHSQDDCDFVMHYLSGQCEEQVARGTNVTGVCDESLSMYLRFRDLFTKDFPTDDERFNDIMGEFNQKVALAEEEFAEGSK